MNQDTQDPLGLSTTWPRALYSRLKALHKQHCLLCLAPNIHGLLPLCASCHTQLPLYACADNKQKHRVLGCIICADALRDGLGNMICGSCINKRPTFDCCIAAAEYRWPIDALLMNFKTKAAFADGRLLSRLLLQRLQGHYQHRPLPDCIVPVPLHWQRKAQRGFNQSTEIAKWLSGWLNVPIRTNLVHRAKHTNNQKNLPKRLRARNIRGAFDIKWPNKMPTFPTLNKNELYEPPGDKTNIPKYVAIIDDVVTTGATANELSRVLRQAGVKHIDVWCLARTEAENDTLSQPST